MSATRRPPRAQPQPQRPARPVSQHAPRSRQSTKCLPHHRHTESIFRISDQDVPHRIAFDWIYQLPFGDGRKYLANGHPVLGKIVGGWEVTGAWTLQSGLPLNLTSDYFLTGDPTLSSDQQTLQRWFNTAAFVTASAAQPVFHLRTNPIRFPSLRAPRQDNVDLSLIKDTKIHENQVLRFDAQALNAFNHPLFPAPNLSVTAAQFGVISASTQANYPRRLQLELKYIF